MKTNPCERCSERNATVHVTFIASSFEIGTYHFCEACFARAQEEHTASYGKLARHLLRSSIAPLPIRNSFVKQAASCGQVRRREFPAGLWSKCDRCETLIPEKQLKANLRVCPRCRNYFPMAARERIELVSDSFEELNSGMMSVDVLNFVSAAIYQVKAAEHRQAAGQKDAVVTGFAQIGEHRAGLGVLDFNFLGGAMGSVMSEKLARLIERCTEAELPVIIISASAGARIHEGTFSAMQMAKTSAALGRHERAGLPYISVLTSPTIGGVLATFAGVGGVVLAEPRAMIGLTGERADFQTAESLFSRGLIDEIVTRRWLKKRLIDYLDFMGTDRVKVPNPKLQAPEKHQIPMAKAF